MLRKTQFVDNSYLIKQLPKATAFINTDLEIVYASDEWIHYFDLQQHEVIGMTVFELFGNSTEEWKGILEKCFSGGPKETGIQSFIDANNTEQWFEWINVPWYDDKGTIIGAIVETTNITQRILKEIKLEKLKIILEQKSEIAKLGSWEYNLMTEKVCLSNTAKKLLEIPLDATPTLTESLLFYKEGYSRNTIGQLLEKALKNESPWKEKLQMVTAKGNEIWVAASGKSVFKNGECVGIVGTFQNINEQVLSEIKTKENEHLLKTLINHLPLNVYIKDLDSRKIVVNKSECEFLGAKNPEEILGKSDFELYDKELAQSFREEDLEVFHSLKPLLGKETIHIKENGMPITLLNSKIPLKGNNGEAYGLVGIGMDISHIKQHEEDLRNLINVTSLQNKKLVNFAHIVSHNLRSHTANFSMLLDFLTNEKEEDEKNRIINMLISASNNLLDTLNNLNEVVAINTNINIEKVPVNLNDKITLVTQNLSTFLRNNNASIVNKIPEDTYIKVVPAYIDNILMNFLTNAVKYRHPDRDPIITLSLSKNKEYTVVGIEDNGLGIDLKKHGKKLFGMYKTFHENPEAKGIGLYITKNQIEAMNGKISTQSEVGKGTLFNIYFNESN